jgi:hypothetical protein
MLEMETPTKTQFYDCVECGQKDCVFVKGIYGFCKTPGCLNRDLIQFVYIPKWNKPKASRAGRDILWIK